MSTSVIVAQIFTLIALVLYTLSLQFRDRSKVLKWQIAANCFYALEYLMLNAYAGVNSSLFGISRSILFYIFQKQNKKCPIYVACIFLTLILIFGFISYDGIFSILPVIISIIFFLALYSEDMRLYRIVTMIVAILWIIYNSVVKAYVGVIESVIELIASIIAIYHLDIKHSKKKKLLRRK